MTPEATRQDRLAAMDDAWRQADTEDKSEKKEWENPPDGEYQARVHSFDFHDGKSGLALRTQFELLGPHNAGWKVSTFHPLEDTGRLKWTKLHLNQLGVNASSLVELEAALPEALDQVCDVVLKTRKVGDREYQNLYVNRVMNGVTASASEPVSDAPPPHEDFDRPKPKDDDLDSIPF